MIKEESIAIYEHALEKWGSSPQILMTFEECSELMNALCKYNRGRCEESDVITEIADVMIMAEQMAVVFGIDAVRKEKDRKLERLKERLNG